MSSGLTASVDADGRGRGFDGSPLRYDGLIARDADGRDLPAWLDLDGRTLLIRVDDRGARYPVDIDPTFEQALFALPFVDTEGIAVSDDTIVVGAPGQGALVFVKPANGWANATVTARLTSSIANTGSFFVQRRRLRHQRLREPRRTRRGHRHDDARIA